MAHDVLNVVQPGKALFAQKHIDVRPGIGGGMMAGRIAVGETLRLRVVEVTQVEGGPKYRTVLRDEDGAESVLLLDVCLPLGMAEVSVLYLGEGEGFRPG